MANNGRLPGVDHLTSAYFDAWENFGDEKFTTEELRNELLKESTEPENVSDETTIYSSLYRAATIGLVVFHGEKTFSVQITPEFSKEERHEVATNHIDRLWKEVEKERDRRAEQEREVEEKSVLTYDEDSFIRTFVGRNTDIEENLEGYFQAAFDPEEHTGVVLESWTSVAEAADKLAEDLTDDDLTSNVGLLYRFEKAGEEVTTDEKGEKVLRIYLKETRFS